jgi:formate hydrogenlyase subunit 3/multisubunit Na+/H+ antiporter MnhD subunit
MHDWLSFLWAFLLLSTATHSEESSKQIIHTTSMSTTIFEAFLSIFVISITLLFVGKNFISLLNFLEFFLVSATIGVFLQSLLSEGFSDLIE